MVKIKKCLDTACTKFILTEEGDLEMHPKKECDPKSLKKLENKDIHAELEDMAHDMTKKHGKLRLVFEEK